MKEHGMNAIERLEQDTSTVPLTVTRQTFDEVMVPTYAPSAVVPVRASGLDLWDQEGRQYLDLTGGIAVTSLGHCSPVVIEALQKQASTL
jgi:succinylornithine aminotransferase